MKTLHRWIQVIAFLLSVHSFTFLSVITLWLISRQRAHRGSQGRHTAPPGGKSFQARWRETPKRQDGGCALFYFSELVLVVTLVCAGTGTVITPRSGHACDAQRVGQRKGNSPGGSVEEQSEEKGEAWQGVRIQGAVLRFSH